MSRVPTYCLCEIHEIVFGEPPSFCSECGTDYTRIRSYEYRKEHQ